MTNNKTEKEFKVFFRSGLILIFLLTLGFFWFHVEILGFNIGFITGPYLIFAFLPFTSKKVEEQARKSFFKD